MPSELQRVASELLACIDRIPAMTHYLLRTAGRCREQAAYLVAFGSTSPATRTAALQLDAAARACEHAAEYAGRVPPRARSWVDQMVTGERTATPRPTAPTGSYPPSHRDLALWKRVPIRNDGDPTTGIGVDDNGNEVTIISGYDDMRDRARELCREKGWPDFKRSHHVEIKFAMKMRSRGLSHAALYINKKPCDEVNWSCDKLLPRFLPPGSTLRVFGPDGYEKLFKAREPES